VENPYFSYLYIQTDKQTEPLPSGSFPSIPLFPLAYVDFLVVILEVGKTTTER
jgi:hypothetical protein